MSSEQDATEGRILVVDDEILNRILLSTSLQESGYTVDTAEDGRQALEMLSAQPFDIVLLDLVMPGMDGYAVCEQIKASERTHDLPVIFISAMEETGDKVRALGAGGADYVTKPFQFEEVLARVETHLALRQLQRRLQAANRELERQLQEVQAWNEELDAFAHTVAHDLKNPLSVIVGYSTVLEDRRADLPDEQLDRYLGAIARHGRKMTNIIEELLLLASVRKVDEVEMEPLDMAAIVAEVQERLADLIAAQQAQISAPDEWPAALGRAPWVEEVWVNYLSNAIKYGGQPPRIDLGFTIYDFGFDPPGQHSNIQHPIPTIKFWVRDNGPGLTAEEQVRLFAPFERLHQVRAEGHGLGLSIVRRIVEKLGGQIGVESEPGQGCLFYFTLPAMDDAGASDQQTRKEQRP
jgi:two-component system sensor histidine kinase/response regulator